MSQFVPNYSKIALPLYQLTQKDNPFVWTSQYQAAFETLKKLLSECPILAFPDFSLPFQLETNTSRQGLGAVLAQQHRDNTVHPVAYASRTLQPPECNYSATDLEALGLVVGNQTLSTLPLWPQVRGLHRPSNPKSIVSPPFWKVSQVGNNIARVRFGDLLQAWEGKFSTAYKLLDYVLYRTLPDKTVRIIPPQAACKELFDAAHQGHFGAHLKEDKIVGQLATHWWWPGMRADVRRWIRACQTCLECNPGRTTRPPLTPIPVGNPFDRVGADVV